MLEVIKQVRNLVSDTPLVVSSSGEISLAAGGPPVVAFSNKFREKLGVLAKQGYQLHSAEIAHVVVWYCEEDGKEYRVPLTKVGLKKK